MTDASDAPGSPFLHFAFGSFTPAKSRNCDIENDLIASFADPFLANQAPGDIDISSRSVSYLARPSMMRIRSSSTLLT